MPRLLPALLVAICLCGQQSPDRWQDLRFVIGEWTATDGGAFSFVPELGGKILVRRSVNPSAHHEDVMTVYLEAAGKTPEAIYFDNEGHVIHYTLEIDAAAKTVHFVSPAQPGQPR